MADITVNEVPGAIVRRKRRSIALDIIIRLFTKKPWGAFAACIVIALAIMAIFAPQLSPHGWNEISLYNRLAPPSPEFPLGTDNAGRCVLSRIIYGSRISISVMLIAQSITLVLKLLIAVPSGYWGGSTYDTLVQRFVDAWAAIPNLALYLTVMSVLGPGLLQVALVLGINGGISGTRVIRSAVMRIKEDVYLEAAKAGGVSSSQIMLRHIIPNVMPLIVISLAAGMGGVISAEASLSFLGFGIPPPYPSWGGMLSGSGRTYMMVAPWMMLWPGVALSAVVFAFQMLADALRDLIDPRLRGGLGRYGGMTQQELEKLAAKKIAVAAKSLSSSKAY